MIGLIVTGHGNFASGLSSSLQLIMGQLENYKAVDFLEDDTTKSLTNKILMGVIDLKDCDEFIILTDLVGGTPFKVSATIANTNEKIKVLSGTNLGLLIDLALNRMIAKDVNQLITNALDNAKQQLIVFEGVKTREVSSEDVGI